MSDRHHRFDKILKFGGSSVGSPKRIQNVIEIIKKAYDENPLIGVVVSAFGGATDQLIALGNASASGVDYEADLERFFARHLQVVDALVPQKKVMELENEFEELKSVLQGVSLVRELSPKTQDLLMSFGERWSARIITQAIQPLIPEAKFMDARDIIKTDRRFGCAGVDFSSTNDHIQKTLSNTSCVSIITGFIGSSEENETTTLGRGGSDYTASIVGAALEAKSIEIWTDVSGIFTADPRREPNALPIEKMSYKEAMEVSYFGAKVLYLPAIIPACEKKIPLLIKNSFDPQAAGTLICDMVQGSSELGISMKIFLQLPPPVTHSPYAKFWPIGLRESSRG